MKCGERPSGEPDEVRAAGRDRGLTQLSDASPSEALVAPASLDAFSFALPALLGACAHNTQRQNDAVADPTGNGRVITKEDIAASGARRRGMSCAITPGI